MLISKERRARLSSIYRANKTLLGSQLDLVDDHKHVAIEFWNEVTTNMEPWKDFLRGKPPYKLRIETIVVNDISLQAIAILGAELQNNSEDWRKELTMLNTIDWTRRARAKSIYPEKWWKV